MLCDEFVWGGRGEVGGEVQEGRGYMFYGADSLCCTAKREYEIVKQLYYNKNYM